MLDNIGSDHEELHPQAFAVKRWLRMACDRLALYPKAVYLPLGVDAGTWSRWLSLEHHQTLPMGYLPAVLDLLDEQAWYELQDILAPPKKRPGATRA
jgi:hypothetical protein